MENGDTGASQQEQSDFDKVQSYLQEQVQTLFKSEVERYQAQRDAAQRGVSPEQQQQQALREYLAPVVQPDLQRALLESADAKDLMSVINDPLYQEYRDDVETVFEQAKKAGRPLPRRDLLQYVMGKEVKEHPDKFKERLAKREKEQLDRAASATDMGAANIARNPAQLAATMDEFAKLPSEEQARYLDGITF